MLIRLLSSRLVTVATATFLVIGGIGMGAHSAADAATIVDAAPARQGPGAPTPRGIAAPAGGQRATTTTSRLPRHSGQGVILEVTGSQVVLRRANGGVVRIAVTSSTRIRLHGQRSTISDVHAGDHVVIVGIPRGDGELVATGMLVTRQASPPRKPQPPIQPGKANKRVSQATAD